MSLKILIVLLCGRGSWMAKSFNDISTIRGSYSRLLESGIMLLQCLLEGFYSTVHWWDHNPFSKFFGYGKRDHTILHGKADTLIGMYDISGSSRDLTLRFCPAWGLSPFYLSMVEVKFSTNFCLVYLNTFMYIFVCF